MIGVGIVGCNYGRNVLLPAFRADARCEVVALAGRDVARARELARAANVPLGVGDWRLLVEDEALVGLMIADFLGEIGFKVLGPFTKTHDGLSAARSSKFAAAVLDVNVGGEEIYPLADYLRERGIPFVFVTGYGADSIDGRFAGVPVVQKPVDRDTLKRVLLATPEQIAAGAPVFRSRAAAG